MGDDLEASRELPGLTSYRRLADGLPTTKNAAQFSALGFVMVAVLILSACITSDDEQPFSNEFLVYGDAAATLSDATVSRQNMFLIGIARLTQGAGPGGTEELVELEALAVDALEETIADILTLRDLTPDVRQLRADEFLEESLNAERDFYARWIVVVGEGIRATRAGGGWTFPEDSELDRLTERIESAAASYNGELDKFRAELEALTN